MTRRSTKTPWLYVGIVLSQLFHSLEEYLTGFYHWMATVTGYLHRATGIIPAASLSAPQFLAVNAGIVVSLGLVGLGIFWENPWAIKIGVWVAALELVNGGGHLAMALYLRMYVPGCVTAVGLIVFSLLFLKDRFLGQRGSRRA